MLVEASTAAAWKRKGERGASGGVDGRRMVEWRVTRVKQGRERVGGGESERE